MEHIQSSQVLKGTKYEAGRSYGTSSQEAKGMAFQSIGSGLGKHAPWQSSQRQPSQPPSGSQKRPKPRIQNRDHDDNNSSSDDPIDMLSNPSLSSPPRPAKSKKEVVHDSAKSAFTFTDGKYKNLKITKKSQAQGASDTPTPTPPVPKVSRTASLAENHPSDALKRKGTDSNPIDIVEVDDASPPPRPMRSRSPNTRKRTTTTKPAKPQVQEKEKDVERPRPRPRNNKTARPCTEDRSIILSKLDALNDDCGSVPAPSVKSKPKQKKPSVFPMSSEASSPPSSPSTVSPPTTLTRQPSSFPMEGIEPSPTKVSTRRGPKKRKMKPGAFPMDMGGAPDDDPSSSSSSSREGTKRRSPGYSTDDGQAKKKRRSISAHDGDDSDDDDDITFLSSQTDPKTLCPFCDRALPPNPTSLLLRLMERTRAKARRDPRPTNPLGLKAPLTAYITVCQRHRFESSVLPEAEAKGWPKSIAWDQLAERVQSMEGQLRTLIQAGHDGPDGSSFWRTIMNDVKEQGSVVIDAVVGQLASFEKTQPGYYGEQGSMIIHQTLYSLFPPSTFDTTHIAPLTPNQFIEKVLVPEVAVRLVMEDRAAVFDDIDMEEAKKIIRESSSYGASMFPVDGADWDVLDENIKNNKGKGTAVKEAPKRKKEKQKEKETEAESGRTRRYKARKVTKEVLTTDGEASVTDLGSAAETARPKPRPRIKKTSASAPPSDTDEVADTFLDLTSNETSSKDTLALRKGKEPRGLQHAEHDVEEIDVDGSDEDLFSSEPQRKAAAFPMDDLQGTPRAKAEPEDFTPRPAQRTLREGTSKLKAKDRSRDKSKDGWKYSMRDENSDGDDGGSTDSSVEVQSSGRLPALGVSSKRPSTKKLDKDGESLSWLLSSDDSQPR